jgi:hypothetical protein
MIVTLCSIPFQKGKLRKVQAPPFPFSPAPADLKDLLISCCHHALHAKFRRGMKEPGIGGDGINMGFWCGSGYSVRGLYFQVTVFNKKLPDPL